MNKIFNFFMDLFVFEQTYDINYKPGEDGLKTFVHYNQWCEKALSKVKKK